MEAMVEANIQAEAARSKIFAFENLLLQMPQEDVPVTHTFCDGMYARAAFFKKGIALTGSIHRQANLNIMVSGDVTVATEEGETRLTGFNIMASAPGTKRAGYVHEDTIWVTILRTDETDVPTIERTLVTNDAAEIPKLKGY